LEDIVDFTFDARGTCSSGLVVLTGRHDRAAAEELKARVRTTVAGGWNRLVVDLDAVSFIDSSGLEALIGALRAARGAGGDFRLARPVDAVRRSLASSRMDGVLCAHATVEEAFDVYEAANPTRPPERRAA
jgi:anti-sigma B factor antagonist